MELDSNRPTPQIWVYRGTGGELVKQVVTVWNKDYEITVVQKSKTVWIAVGEYKDDRLEVKGSSASSAASAWREAAKYRGN
jgi:hypothetical protein